MATFRPASERRFAAQPPEAPEPTTRTSKFVGESGVGICAGGAIVGDRDAGFYEEDASKRGGGRQRKKMDFGSAKILLDGCERVVPSAAELCGFRAIAWLTGCSEWSGVRMVS